MKSARMPLPFNRILEIMDFKFHELLGKAYEIEQETLTKKFKRRAYSENCIGLPEFNRLFLLKSKKWQNNFDIYHFSVCSIYLKIIPSNITSPCSSLSLALIKIQLH
jgi:hypothetical protein